MNCFRLVPDDDEYADRWFLRSPVDKAGQEIDPREFCYGRPYLRTMPASVPINEKYPGREIAFNLAAFDMPVVSAVVASRIEEIAGDEVEFFPIEISNASDRYLIMNIAHQEDCLDEERTEHVTKWTSDSVRPDKAGECRVAYNIRIDPCRTHGRSIFRIKGWLLPIIASERIKEALIDIPNLGVCFQSVT